jgi:type II secretory pathway component PulJ
MIKRFAEKSLSSQGIGLPELLISLFLASFIIVGLVNLYLGAKKEYFYLQDRLEREIDVLTVIEAMRDSIRRAGFTPCLNIDQLTTYDTRTDKFLLPAITFDSHNSALKISRMSEQFSSVESLQQNSELSVHDRIGLKKKQWILIADCMHAEVHQVAEVTHHFQDTQITLERPLRFTYEKEIYVGEWIEEIFYIHKDDENSALYYQFHHTDELTNLVNSMKMYKKIQRNQQQIEITLGLNNGKEVHFSTVVRE